MAYNDLQKILELAQQETPKDFKSLRHSHRITKEDIARINELKDYLTHGAQDAIVAAEESQISKYQYLSNRSRPDTPFSSLERDQLRPLSQEEGHTEAALRVALMAKLHERGISEKLPNGDWSIEQVVMSDIVNATAKQAEISAKLALPSTPATGVTARKSERIP